MLNTFSDSIRDRQEEKKQLSPKEEKRLRSRNDELESKIEKLSSGKKTPPSEDEPSFFEKLRNRGSLLETKPVINQAFIPKTGPSARSVPIVTKMKLIISIVNGKASVESYEEL